MSEDEEHRRPASGSDRSLPDRARRGESRTGRPPAGRSRICRSRVAATRERSSRGAGAPAGDGDPSGDGRRSGEDGTVTAELVVAIPAVLAVLLLSLAALQLAASGLLCSSAAAAAARSLGRGESEGAALAAVAARVPDGRTAVTTGDGLVCVVVAEHGRGALAAARVSARSCAASGGR